MTKLALPRLHRPALFVTGTDTGVGKTVVTCAIAAALRQQRPEWALGVCKPFATGCRREREGLVSPDAEALAHFADCRLPLATINPIRLADPLAPAAAAERAKRDVDWPALAESLDALERASDALLIEGVGGLMVPLDPRRPRVTVLDLIAALGAPVVVVARAGLGTLNHTAMTVRLLERQRCRVAGIVVNGYEPDEGAAAGSAPPDLSMASNRQWLARLTGVRVLTVVPRLEPAAVAPERATLDQRIIEPVAMGDWGDLCMDPARGARRRRRR